MDTEREFQANGLSFNDTSHLLLCKHAFKRMFESMGLTVAPVGVKTGPGRAIHYAARGDGPHVTPGELSKLGQVSTTQFHVDLQRGWWYPWGSSQPRSIKDFT